MTAITFRFDWPPPPLWPNRRHHWRTVRAISRGQQDIAALCVLMHAKRVVPDGPLTLSLEFHPPTHRSYDRDNAIAACKAGIDGMTRALGIDDRRFVETRGRMGPVDPDKRGFVVARIERDAAPTHQETQ